MPAKQRLHALTIYLVKASCTTAEAVIKSPGSLTKHRLPDDGPLIGDPYVQHRSPDAPTWAAFFREYLPPSSLGQTASPAAVLVVQAEQRFFAITFGNGRFLLAPDVWEDRFGLRVVLNCIGPNTVRSIDKHSLDQLTRHTREQASRDAAPREFGLDVEQDLLQGVTGTPADIVFGSRITGMDAVHVTVPVEARGLQDFLGTVYDKYSETTYQQNFPWVDHIAEVRDGTQAATLDGLLITNIAAGKTDKMWMAAPEIVDWKKVGGFRFPRLGLSPEFFDIHLDYFLETVPDKARLDKDTLVHRRVVCVDQNGDHLYAWQAYKCLYAEIEHQNDIFLLSGGRWYRVTPDFVRQINEAYSNVPDYSNALPEFNDKTEGDYIKRVAKGAPRQFAVMDQKTIAHGGGQSTI